MRRREAVIDLYKVVLGSFLFVSPWLFAFSYGPARADAFASGAILVLVSGLTIFAFTKWEEWISLLIGCWVLASPWVLGFPHRSGMHVAAAVGAVIVYLSALELWLIHNRDWLELPGTPKDHSTGRG
jgi:SPW repeat-containing protein